MGGQPSQHDATAFNPDGLFLVEAASLQRDIGASLVRVWENVADWEHLPWLHKGSFSAIALQDSGAWGWRAELGAGAGRSVVELVWDKAKNHYVARTLEGGLAGMEIWTTLTPKAEHVTAIDVRFHVPLADQDGASKIGQVLHTTYQTLWDEDEAMMQARERALAHQGALVLDEPVALGDRDELISRLPLTIMVKDIPVRVVWVDGEILAFNALCPHMLGPLEEAEIEGRCVRCPWHGYQFDLGTGASADGKGLSLLRGPDVVVEADTGLVSLV